MLKTTEKLDKTSDRISQGRAQLVETEVSVPFQLCTISTTMLNLQDDKEMMKMHVWCAMCWDMCFQVL